MTLDVSQLLPYGPLEPLEVYFEHEGPKFFALQAPVLGLRILVICIDDGDDEQGVVTYLYLPLSTERFAAIRSGRVRLRDAFAAQNQMIWRVREDYTRGRVALTATPVPFEELSDRDLPAVGAAMDLPTATAAVLQRAELRDRAEGARRTIAAVELEAGGERSTEFPLRGVGRVSLALQDTLDALAHEDAQKPNARGATASELAADVQVSIVGLRAASFAIVLGSSPREQLIVNPRLHTALSELMALIEGAADPPALVRALYQHDRRARSRFVALLQSVGDYASGIGIVAAEVDTELRETHASPLQVTAALDAIGRVTVERQDIEVPRAMLTASNTTRHTFELIDAASGTKYSGSVDPPARGQIEGLNVGHSSFVSATLVADIEFASEDDEKGRAVTLMSIRSRD